MEIYNTEEEQVEALKRWWDENGKSLLLGLAVVLAAVFAFKSWQQHTNNQAEAAGYAYQNMLDALIINPTVAEEKARAIVGEYPGSSYAVMASFALARLAADNGDTQQAQAHLQWVVGNADEEGLKDLAQLRMAKLALQDGQPGQALASLEKVKSPSFRAEVDELRGDSLLEQGKKDDAIAAYRNALSGYASLPAKRDLVEMKLADLAPVGGSAQ